MLSRELTNPVFTDIAFSTSHTYSHWRRTPRNTRCAGRGQTVGGPASKNPILQGENLFFNIIFFRDQPKKNYEKTDGSGVLAERIPGPSSYATAYSRF